MIPKSVIKATKTNFARYGICQRLCSDNGTNFINQQMKTFAKDYGFEHVTSSPNHQQANGKAEAAVKIAKSLIKKAEKNQSDYELALLHWRNTPIKIGSSPNQRLMSRQTQTLIPTSIKNLQPRVIENVPESIKKQRNNAKEYYDRKTQTRPELRVGQPVMVQLRHDRDKTWTPAKVTTQLNDRAYEIATDEGTYRRDRIHVKQRSTQDKTKEEESPADLSWKSAQEEVSEEEEEEKTATERVLRDRNKIKAPEKLNL